MHPIKLMRKYRLTYLQLADAIGVSEAAARRWAFNPKANSYREPPQTVYRLSAELDHRWSREGLTLVLPIAVA